MMSVKVIASGSDGNCYRVSDGNTTILLDAGIQIKRIRQGCDFKLSAIDACFVTHSHQDHCKAVPDLVRLGIPVYMSPGEIEAMGVSGKGVRRVYVNSWDEIGTMQIIPFPLEHDTPEPIGFYICSMKTGERLVYFTDTYYIHAKFGAFDYLIGEVNYDEETLWEHVEDGQTAPERAKRLFHTHMSLKTFLEFLRANDLSRLKKIWICHMSNDHGNAEKIKRAVQQETGVEVEVC